MPWLSAALLLLTTVPAFRPPRVARRWGALGHRIIAQVALDRLSPGVAAETRRLLDGASITDIASWADEQRRALPGTAAWHFVDIEIGDSTYVPARDCKNDSCIIAALNHQIQVLGDASRPDSERATALKWVVHLVGDIHQPLHASDRGDRGGNDVHILFNGKTTNLHSIWDTGMLQSFGQSEDQIVEQIEQEISRRHDINALTASSPAQWAMESHNLARDVVYRNLPNSLEVGQAYIDAARPVIYEQLLRGGVRLAAVLERALKR